MTKFILIFLLFVLLTTETKSVPRIWYGGINASRFHDYPPKISTVGPSIIDEKIVFAEPPKKKQNPPTPCENSDFCEDVPYYPDDLVEAALRGQNFEFLARSDVLPGISNRGGIVPEDTPLCETRERVVYPKVARNVENEWLYVVNHGSVSQGVHVEECVNEDGECDYVYVNNPTTCKQKYIYKQLVAVNSDGRATTNTFKFPSTCCCYIKNDDDFATRFGSRIMKKTKK